ncbi:MAG: hypothetical protein GTO40_12685 [Deltaproteobacteria bacterium]|nr:hypothetical protein [Deltaproteobacteria bacterium]
MKVMNAVLISLVIILAVCAYFQGDGRHISGLSKGMKMLFAIVPAFVCASLIAGYLQVLLPESVIQGWLGDESGLKGIAVGYLAGFSTFGGPFVSFPVAASLYQAGASVATVTTFITSWAIWGGGIIFYELSILGPRLFAIRITASFFFPLIAGLIAGYLAKSFT